MGSEIDILRLLGIRHPIIQAPMVGVSTPKLAAAVSNAGALGSIGVGASTAEEAMAMIRSTRALTDKSFNVSLFCHAPAVADPVRETAWLEHLAPFFAEFDTCPPAKLTQLYRSFLADEGMLDVLLQERPSVVSFHFGIPSANWICALRNAGIATLACITTPEEGIMAEHAGADALIAQGVEAGGHRGVFDPTQDREIGTLALIPMITGYTRLPVIAAGGIMDGRGIATALRLGAAAVQMGTAFILAPESAASAQYRAALQSDLAQRTQVTATVSGRPARGLANRLITDLCGPLAPPLADYPLPYHAAKALHAAASAKGNHDFAAHWAGQGAPHARAMPASELVHLLVREMDDAYAASSSEGREL